MTCLPFLAPCVVPSDSLRVTITHSIGTVCMIIILMHGCKRIVVGGVGVVSHQKFRGTGGTSRNKPGIRPTGVCALELEAPWDNSR